MSNSISNELDNLSKSFKLYRLRTELNFYQQMEKDTNLDRINILLNIINELEGNKIKDKIHNFFDNIDKLVYKKPWKRLPEFHKIIKIKEYLDEKYKTNDKRNIIEELLINTIKTKDTTKGNYIIYDENICKITDIPGLKNIDGQYKLILNENKKI